jgi:hypothetical protein
MNCDLTPNFNFDVLCKEIPRQHETLSDFYKAFSYSYTGKFTFRPFTPSLIIHGRLPRKIKKKYKKAGFKMSFV